MYLDTTDGYVLTTSVDETPQTQHTLAYAQQPNGSWLASGSVNVMANAVTLLSGSVTLQDPSGEILTLPISIEPSLFVDSSVIAFDDTKLGDTIATILNVRQRGVIAPVSLHLEPRQQFAIADAKTPMVTVDKLTIMPSFDGSNIIISYKPNRAGRHKARLVVSTPYDTKTVQLQGQTGGLLSRFQIPQSPRLRLTIPAIPYPARLVNGLAVVGFVGLIWMSYQVLTRSENKTDLAVLTRKPSRAYVSQSTPASRPQKAVDVAPESTLPPPPATTIVASAPVEPPSPKALPKPTEPVAPKKPVVQTDRPDGALVAKVYRPKQVTPAQTVSAQKSAFSADQISDLEKELNGPTSSNKP